MTLKSLLEGQPAASGYLLICAVLCLTSAIYLAATFIYNIFFHPLASFPGPVHYRGSPLPHLVQEWRGNTVHRWVELHEKYGDVVRISPNQLSYISVNAWRDIYGARGINSNNIHHPKGTGTGTGLPPPEMLKEELEFPGDDFEFFAPEKPMISCDAVNHARHRRAVGPAFSDRAVRSYEPLLIKYTEEMLDRLVDQQTLATSGVNIMDWFHFVMFDITSALVFGESFGNMAKGEYHAWVARVFPGMKLIAWSLVIAAIPGLGRAVSWFIPRKMVDEARRHMQTIVDMTDSRRQAAATQQQQQQDQPDFMTFIHCPSPPTVNRQLSLPLKSDRPSSSSSGSHNTLSTPELYLNSQLLCIAGSETTASLLAGTVYFLCGGGSGEKQSQPHHLETLLTELESNFQSEDEITPSKLNPTTTPFLCAVLNEVLRLYPPGAINMPRRVPRGKGKGEGEREKNGVLIDGKFVPAGTVVGIAQYAAYRSPMHWTDPLRFAPERWLLPLGVSSPPHTRITTTTATTTTTTSSSSISGSPTGTGSGSGNGGSCLGEKYRGDRREVFKPFSYGPRNCIGQNLALAECRLIIARLFWRFRVEILPGHEGWINGQRTFLSWEKPPLLVRLVPRVVASTHSHSRLSTPNQREQLPSIRKVQREFGYRR